MRPSRGRKHRQAAGAPGSPDQNVFWQQLGGKGEWPSRGPETQTRGLNKPGVTREGLAVDRGLRATTWTLLQGSAWSQTELPQRAAQASRPSTGRSHREAAWLWPWALVTGKHRLNFAASQTDRLDMKTDTSHTFHVTPAALSWGRGHTGTRGSCWRCTGGVAEPGWHHRWWREAAERMWAHWLPLCQGEWFWFPAKTRSFPVRYG